LENVIRCDDRLSIFATVTITIILAVIVHLHVGTAFATTFDEGQERRIVDAILNQNYVADHSIETMINALDIERALIPEPDFYRSLALWYRGYQNEDNVLKKRGIRSLQKLSKKAEEIYVSGTQTNNFIVGIIKAYTARALFENKQVIKGYYTGLDAVERLQKFSASASAETAGYYDAKFLLALYSVYTHDLKNRDHWLIGTVHSVGNKKESISNIHMAIKSNAIFASESARSFLAEVQWRTPDICNYRDLAQNGQTTLPNNLDFALLAQGLLLKCGYPDMALEINNRFHTRTNFPEPVSNKLLKARLRILTNLGNTDQINALNLPATLRSHQKLALANSLDVNRKREQAVAIYQNLVDDTGIAKDIKRVAMVRLTYPYRRPKRIANIEELSQLRISSSGEKEK